MKHIHFAARAGTALIALAAIAACNRGGGQESAEGEKAEGAFSIEQGEWELTTEITDVSMDGFPNRTKDQVRELEREAKTQRTCVPVSFSVDSLQLRNMRFGFSRRGNCNIAEISMGSGALKTRVNCSGLPDDMTVSAQLDGDYDEDSYRMTFRADVEQEGEDRRGSVEGRIEGRRLGRCESSPDSPGPIMNDAPPTDMNMTNGL